MLADPLAYPLVLAAVYAGVCMVSEPTKSAQLAFAVFSALAIFARVQYVVVPLAVLGAELVADRCNLLKSVRRVWLALVVLIVPPALLFATLGSERVLGVYSKGNHGVHLGSLAHWLGLEAMLLLYSSGWVIVPGALAGIAFALWRSGSRAELAFALTTVFLALALMLEAAQIADTDSQRFQERYLFTLVPLLAVAFGLYVKRGLPGRIPLGLLSAGMLLVAARVPLSGYAAAHNKDDSPTLWAVLRLESSRPSATAHSPSRSIAAAAVRARPHSSSSARCRRRSRSSERLPRAARCLPAQAPSMPSRARRAELAAHGSALGRSREARSGRPRRAARIAEGAVVAAALLEHLGQASPPRRAAHRSTSSARTRCASRPTGACWCTVTRPQAAARADVRFDRAAHRREARPARADLRSLPPRRNTARADDRRRPVPRRLARPEWRDSPSGRRRAERSHWCSGSRRTRASHPSS